MNSSRSASRFKAWRTRMGWTQAEAAEQLGISRMQVIRLEAGERTDRPGDQVVVDRTLALAMAALEAGLKPVT